jgi:hypothetical protein
LPKLLATKSRYLWLDLGELGSLTRYEGDDWQDHGMRLPRDQSRAMTMQSQARATMRAIRRIMKSVTLARCNRKLVMRNPDKVKNKAIPIGPKVKFNCQDFGPGRKR